MTLKNIIHPPRLTMELIAFCSAEGKISLSVLNVALGGGPVSDTGDSLVIKLP